MKSETDLLLSLLDGDGIEYSPDFADKTDRFTDIFLETAKTLNLTSIKDPHEVTIKHYYDSLCPLRYGYFTPGASMIDVGCGGGFPSMPIKLARPDIQTLQLDSLKKRLAFLDGVSVKLGLSGISTLHARAEEGSRQKELRDSFDIAVSRAVAQLAMLCEYCMPFVKKDGVFLAYKGGDCDDEIAAAVPAVTKLSGKIEDVLHYELPENMGSRCLVVIRKVAATHPMYPRSTKIMSKGAIS